MRLFVFLMILLSFIYPIKPMAQDNNQNKYDIIVRVNGMVCDFCAQSLNKVFSKKEGVKNISVNLDSGTVNIILKEDGKLSDEEIKELIEWGGYDLVSISR